MQDAFENIEKSTESSVSPVVIFHISYFTNIHAFTMAINGLVSRLLINT